MTSLLVLIGILFTTLLIIVSLKSESNLITPIKTSDKLTIGL